MNNKKELNRFLKSCLVKEGKKVSLKKYPTDPDHKELNKKDGAILFQESLTELARMQDILYAENKHSILIILQGLDASGKDGLIKHVMSSLNPQGVRVTSFKAPSHAELEHDYFWRHYKELPGKGDIGIFNRSHYENVLVTRVHPEFILNANQPGIQSLKDIGNKFWVNRFKQINRFEKNLSENGTVIMKFFLHLSKEEQKKRLLERIDQPEKNWKFSPTDLNERQYWDQYQFAYEEMLAATSTDHAPWYILPADDKWLTRLCMGSIIVTEFEKLHLKYPKVSDAQLQELLRAKEILLAEPD